LNIPSSRCFSRWRPSAASRGPAQRLHRTQSAVSQALRRLEDQLGERLVDRSTIGRPPHRGRPRPAGLRRTASLLPGRRGRDGRARSSPADLQASAAVLVGANDGTVHACCPPSWPASPRALPGHPRRRPPRSSPPASAPRCHPASLDSRHLLTFALRPSGRLGPHGGWSTPTTWCCLVPPSAPFAPPPGGAP